MRKNPVHCCCRLFPYRSMSCYVTLNIINIYIQSYSCNRSGSRVGLTANKINFCPLLMKAVKVCCNSGGCTTLEGADKFAFMNGQWIRINSYGSKQRLWRCRTLLIAIGYSIMYKVRVIFFWKFKDHIEACLMSDQSMFYVFRLNQCLWASRLC